VFDGCENTTDYRFTLECALALTALWLVATFRIQILFVLFACHELNPKAYPQLNHHIKSQK
jgi:hypothetical protein